MVGLLLSNNETICNMISLSIDISVKYEDGIEF